MNPDKKYEFIVVGSGAGGATLAMELAKKGRSVLVVERGIRAKKVGSARNIMRYYDSSGTPNRLLKSKEGTILWRTIMAGGTTIVSCGNAARCLEEELAELGINLDREYSDMETGVVPYSKQRLSEGSKRILAASRELGYKMEPMPKLIDLDKCRRCGNCIAGCAYGAKWTALEFLDRAIDDGAEILYSSKVEKVRIENGKAKGITLTNADGYREIMADAVILSAGGLGTPSILQKSGIKEAGDNFFMDLYVNVHGIASDLSQTNEPSMALIDLEFQKSRGFILSPFIQQSQMTKFFHKAERKNLLTSNNDLLGMMVKIADESIGHVNPDGTFSKPVTDKDWDKLNEGTAITREILVKAGAYSESITVSRAQGAHPGGTAAIGKVVDKDLQAKADNLFVCDCSVLPDSPGMPPILTIAALAKRLAKTLAP
ncbi:MAG: GMC family oxidoreductase [Dehalococcoidia bacterium]